MKNSIIKLCHWTLRKLGAFQPQIVFWAPDITEFLMEDVSVCYCPLPVGAGHCVDMGYDFDGKLVGVKIWADVGTRAKLDKIRYTRPHT